MFLEGYALRKRLEGFEKALKRFFKRFLGGFEKACRRFLEGF
jgi:hypothetical protein